MPGPQAASHSSSRPPGVGDWWISGWQGLVELFPGVGPGLPGLGVEFCSRMASREVVTGVSWEVGLCRTGKEGSRFSSCHPSCFLASVSPSGPGGWRRTAPTPTLGHLVNCNVCEWVGVGLVCCGPPHPKGTSESPGLTFFNCKGDESPPPRPSHAPRA